MPFEIVRNDIVHMRVSAIVNTANPAPVIGHGCDAGIHKGAGPKLLKAREKIGAIAVGQAAVTSGYDLEADYVIHAVGPVWQGGTHNEEALLRQCYDSALNLALKKRCSSIAFPLISAGNYGFPKHKALQIAVNAFSSFLMEHEMQIYLVVFGQEEFALSEKLLQSVSSYIDENYVFRKLLAEYDVEPCPERDSAELLQTRRNQELRRRMQAARSREVQPDLYVPPVARAAEEAYSLEAMLSEADAGFSETLLKLIDRTGRKDSEIYKKANVDRKLFSKIKKNKGYKPSKATALAFAIALELDLEETKDFIGRAGFALTHSSKFDIIIEYFIQQKNYNIHEINITLFQFDQSLLGAQ